MFPPPYYLIQEDAGQKVFIYEGKSQFRPFIFTFYFATATAVHEPENGGRPVSSAGVGR
jgi:hypothetical protein